LIVVPLCLTIPIAYLIRSSNQELRQAIADADKLDPGWRLQQLESKRAVVPDEQNSALILMSAQDLLPANWPFWKFPQVPENQKRSKDEALTLQQDLWNSEPPVQFDERQTSALREELCRAGEALAAVQKVVSLPKGRYPKQNNGLPTLRMGHLLAYDALLHAQDKDLDRALASCRGILNCSRALGDELGLTSMMSRIALNWIAAKRTERTLAQGEPSEAALSSIQHDLAAQAEEPLLLIAARGERAWVDEVMQAAQEESFDDFQSFVLGTGGSDPRYRLLLVPGMAKSIRAALLKSNNEFVEFAKLAMEQQAGRIKDLEAAEKDLPQLARTLGFRTRVTATSEFYRDRARLGCAVVMIAVERYRQANNGWPKALTDLVPAYLSKVPLDPYDAAPLRYRRLDHGVVVYSVGPDGKDNGGKFDKEPLKEGSDLGLRLWDVTRRRQPPKPPAKLEQEPGGERD
jgi:hypothetical protein